MVAKTFSKYSYYISLLLLLFLAACKFGNKKANVKEINVDPTVENVHDITDDDQNNSEEKVVKTIKNKKVPDNAYEVANYIYEFNEPPKGFVGGRKFENRENNLPKYDEKNKFIQYKEYDIYPKQKDKNRGPERIVLGSNHKRYYTGNHYKTFIEF